MQLLNVAYGGTLVQDIPSQVTGALPHSLGVPPHESYSLAHEVWLDKGTLLSKLMGERLSDTDACDVNSRHHQAVKETAPGLVVSAPSPGIGADQPDVILHGPVLRRVVVDGSREFLADGRVPPAVRGFPEAAQRPR